MSNKRDDAVAAVPSQELSNDAKDGTLGFLLVGVVRAAMVGLKKGAISSLVRKQAFLQISSLTKIQKTTTITTTDTKIVTSTPWKEYSLKLLKNSVLGMAVFGTYDFVAFEQFGGNPNHNNNRHRHPEPIHWTLSDASYHRSLIATSTPVVVHAGAGLAAGMAHSGVLVLWNLVTRRNHPRHHHWTARRLQSVVVHHSLGYACLFGTYEATRRFLEHAFYDALSNYEVRVLDFFVDHPWNWTTNECDHDANCNKNHTYNVTPIRWTMAFVAGGVAGYAHQLVMHAISHAPTGQWRKMIPTLRPSLSTVWFTGLCFMAFEFGGEWTERTLL